MRKNTLQELLNKRRRPAALRERRRPAALRERRRPAACPRDPE